MKFVNVTVLAAGLAAFVAAPSFAQSKDPMFANKAAEAGMDEVEMGKLAADHASSDDVKKFGQHMVDDHTKANDELKSWASSHNVTLPTDMDAKHKMAKDKLAGMSGAGFDKAYMMDEIKDHKMVIAMFEKESNSGKDPDLKAWAAKTLPTLQDHLKEAERIQGKMAGGM